MKKSKKSEEIQYADGRQEEEEIQRLDKILGIREENPFNVASDQELEGKLENMSLLDLQEYAVKAGVFPSGTKTTLKSKLEKAFSSYRRSRNKVQITSHMTDPESKRGKEVLKILNGEA